MEKKKQQCSETQTINKMNTIKTVFYVLLVIALALYIGGFKISFKPFHIELGSWYNLVGYIFALVALTFLSLGAYKDGYKKGSNETIELVQQTLDETIQQLREESKKDTVTVNENNSEIPDPL